VRSLPAVLALLIAALGFGPSAEAPARQRTVVRYTPRDREAGRYQYVPFDVPEGATRVTVEYRYDRAGGANAVDLGLFEPGPLDLATPAFRGWSGGERTSVTVSPQYATPGYWPGALPAGRWHAALGLYKVADGGVEVEVITETGWEAAGPVPSLPPRPAVALRPGPAWFSGALHLHTVHSDGTLTAGQLSRAARQAGLDFIAITDHNNTTHQLEAVAEEGLLRIVGEEVTTPGGHANVWGLGGARDYVDFRVLPGDPRIAEVVAAADARRALVSINHPTADCAACDWTHAIPEGVDALEISSLRPEAQAAAVGLWDRLLQKGRRITAVGTSDWHRGPQPIDAASVRVWAAELSERGILDGLQAGRVVVMADGRTPPPVLTARCGNGRTFGLGDTVPRKEPRPCRPEVEVPAGPYRGARIELHWNGAKVAEAPAEGPVRFAWTPLGPGHLRIHVFGADGAPRAVTNPIYFE
jgi:hypothetical protein